MTRSGIEPWSPGPLANTLPTSPTQKNSTKYIKKLKVLNAFKNELVSNLNLRNYNSAIPQLNELPWKSDGLDGKWSH